MSTYLFYGQCCYSIWGFMDYTIFWILIWNLRTSYYLCKYNLTSIDNQNVFYSFLQNYMSRNSVLFVLIIIISFFSFLRIFSFKKVISYSHHIGSLLASRLIRTRLTDAYFFDSKIIDNSAFTTTIVNHLQAYVSLLQNISSAVSSLISVLAIFALISFQSMDYFVVSC